MDYIPVYLDLPTVLILNGGVLVLCLLMLLIPSWIITRISPARAIRFA
jgi:lipoprotein-releasing system permease protein